MTRLFFKKFFFGLGLGLLSANIVVANTTTTVQVFPNIFTLSSSDEPHANASFIITTEGVVVVDTGINNKEADHIISEIRKRTDKPIRFAINTQYFGGRTLGNQVFRKVGAIIVSNRSVQKALGGKTARKDLEDLRNAGVPGLENIKITPPNMVFHKRLDWILGGLQIKVIRVGPAQTDGDTIVFFPELQAVISGGLITNRSIPDLTNSHIEGWIKALFQIEDLEAEIIIPGVGDVGHKPIAIQMRHFLLDLKQQVQVEISKGKNVKETLQAVRPFFKGKYSHWKGQHRMDANIKKAFEEYQQAQKKETGQNL